MASIGNWILSFKKIKRKLRNVQELGNDVPSKPLLFMKVRLWHFKCVLALLIHWQWDPLLSLLKWFSLHFWFVTGCLAMIRNVVDIEMIFQGLNFPLWKRCVPNEFFSSFTKIHSYSMYSVSDPGYLCRIPDPGFKFFHPGSRSKRSRIRIKEFQYF